MGPMTTPTQGSLLLEREYKGESFTSQLLAIHGTFCGISTLSVLLRLYVRVFMLKSIGIDDYIIGIADIFSISALICFIGEASDGGLGQHPSHVSTENFINFLHWRFFHSIIAMAGISLVKISIAFFLRRLLPSKNYQRFLMGSIIFLVAFTISCAGTLIFNCGLKPQANWDVMMQMKGQAKCFSSKTFTNIGIFNSSINIATDVLFALVPVPIVWNLQANMRTKFTLIFILSLGLFACACSIVKAVYQANTMTDPDWTFHDSFFMWNNIELNIGILAASLPALRPLFERMLGVARRLTSSNQSDRAKHGGGYNADGLAYHQNSNMAPRNDARQYYKFDSIQSAELKDPHSRGSTHAFRNVNDKVQGVTSTVTAGDDQSDKILLNQDFHSVSTDKGLNGPSSNHEIIQTTTVQVDRY